MFQILGSILFLQLMENGGLGKIGGNVANVATKMRSKKGVETVIAHHQMPEGPTVMELHRKLENATAFVQVAKTFEIISFLYPYL